MPSVSAVVLTKNNERTIVACIEALKPAVDYVIIVDTGSIDNTVRMAKGTGGRVYRFDWQDDFSEARNFGDSLVTTDWVIHVDSDEILRSEDKDKIRKVCTQYRKTVDPVAITIQQINVMAEGVEVVPITRLYKRGTLVWRGIIHEQLIKRRVERCYLTPSDIGVVHDGYNANALGYYEKVVSRNIRLLEKGTKQEPDNASYHFHLGRDYKLAIPHLRLSIDLFERQNMSVGLEEAHKVLIQCLEANGDYSEVEEVANRVISKFS